MYDQDVDPDQRVTANPEVDRRRDVASTRPGTGAHLRLALTLVMATCLVVVATIAITHPASGVGWAATVVLVVAAFVLTMVV